MAEAIILVNLQSMNKLEDFKVKEKMVCARCKDEKPNTDFVIDHKCIGSRRKFCKACERKRVEELKESKKVDTSQYFDF